MLHKAILGMLGAALTAGGVATASNLDPNPNPPQTLVDTTTLKSSRSDRESVAITVYNQSFALVREVRRMDLPGGRVSLEYQDVSSSLQPETVHISRLGRGNLQVLEQNYRYDLLTPAKLLEKYVGKMITVYKTHPTTGVEEAQAAEVLSVASGVVLRINGEITYGYPGRYAFPEVPDNLIPEPTLVWLLDTERGDQRVEVSYLTQNMGWKADYVLVLADDEKSSDITGWVTLDNRSGTNFENAQLKLVAGDVQRVQNMPPQVQVRAMRAMEMDMASGFSEEGFFEYHLYTLGRPTDVLNNEQKQVTLLEAEDFRTQKRLIFEGAAHYYRSQFGNISPNQKVSTFLEFDNAESEGLGMALPAGIVRVYKQDSDGAQQFIGEDRIDHTPRDERVRIKMGESFDVVGDRTQMDYRVLGRCSSESTWVIELRNHKDEAVMIDVIEHAGGDWEIMDSSHDSEKLDSQSFRFRVNVPARGATKVEFRVRARWC